MDQNMSIHKTSLTGAKHLPVIFISPDGSIKGFTSDIPDIIMKISGKVMKSGGSVLEYLDPGGILGLKEYIENALHGKFTETLAHYHRNDDGGCLYKMSFSPVYEGVGEEAGVFISIQSVREAFVDENQAEHLEEKLYKLLNRLEDLIFVSCITDDDERGKIIEANDTACRVLGYSREELLSKKIADFEEKADADDTSRKAAAQFRGNEAGSLPESEEVCYETVFITNSGDKIYAYARDRVFEYNNVKFMLTVARDVTNQKLTERKLMEKNNQLTRALKRLEQTKQQLIYSEKLACIGQLAAGVAHEINNPLGFIYSNFESSRKNFADFREVLDAYRKFIVQVPDLPADEILERIRMLAAMEKEKDLDFILTDQEEMFRDVEDGLNRISGIVTGLRAFARQGYDNEFEEYDLNRGIHNSLMLVKSDIKYHAGVKLNLGEIPRIRAISSRIDQVLINILLNASYAIREKKMEGQGLITITTDVKDGFVRCRIEDNGMGIEKKKLGQIFDPFFTTKPPGQGTGLGLSIAYDIVVNQHGGQILVESTPKVGSAFTILLPVNRHLTEQGTKNEKKYIVC